ncbi:MAG TPA: hypothetical protein VKP03_02330 [Patescibacteria group bacterium]|nr:hypothetical protein [Patescibacteria group bacterium]
MKKTLTIGLIVVCSVLVFFTADSSAEKAHKINGWAWSENIGWVSLNCYNSGLNNKCLNSDYGVDFDRETKEVFGYSWSEYGGWLCFGSSCDETQENMFLPPDDAQIVAKITKNNLLTGWAGWPVLGKNGWVKLQGEVYNNSDPKVQCRNCVQYKGQEKEKCGFCFTQEINQGSGGICANCSDCLDGECSECQECYKYGVGLDAETNALVGWAWGADYEGVGFGWLRFSASDDLALVNQPYLQTVGGDIYAQKGLGDIYQPSAPEDQPNATYMIQSNGSIVHFDSYCQKTGQCNYSQGWVSEKMDELFLPDQESNYYNQNLGHLDIKGLLAGQYGPVKAVNSSDQIDEVLKGRVYYAGDDFVLDQHSFLNSLGQEKASGTLVVRGDLVLNGNIFYAGSSIKNLKNLPCFGVLVLKKKDGSGGNIYIKPDVGYLSGNFYAEDTIYTGYQSEENNTRLSVNGLMLAEKFEFERGYVDLETKEPAERIIYDGRVFGNPPPGFSDLIAGLPEFNKNQ